MPSLFAVAPAALAAALFWTAVGWGPARWLVPRGLVPGVAPTLGWAITSATALPVLSLTGFSVVTLVGTLAAWLIASVLLCPSPPAVAEPGRAAFPLWAWALAAALAVLPALAIMPKFAGGGVLLGPPMFDHVKVAIIDQITRQGLPPGNPFFAGAGQHTQLSYYYLWHFSAAMLSGTLGVGGWTADIAVTWFTAFASVMLMMSLAIHLAGRQRAAWLVALLCLPASIRPVLDLIAGAATVQRILPPRADIGAWTNQASWVPQHLASGCCVVVAALLIARLARPGLLGVVALALVASAGFESSSWVGGIAFAAACLLTTPLLIAAMPAEQRRPFLVRATLAALITAVLVAPFCISQASDVAARGVGVPIALRPYRALAGAGWAIDLLAFWALVLPFNFPALYPCGIVALRRMLGRSRTDPLAGALGAFAAACLCVTWLLASTIDNNDLGWRAAIPAILLLTVFAAVTWSRWIGRPWRPAALATLLLAAAGLPQAAEKLGEAWRGQRPADAAGFAQSAALWDSVRRLSGPAERVGNNPLMLATMTPWPDDISWALLSNRPSCYPGWATGIAYAGVARAELLTIDALFKRVFAGDAQAGDTNALAHHFDCGIVVVARADGAWGRDAFAASSAYRLVGERAGAWRIYRRR